jgi:hypothetical protein
LPFVLAVVAVLLLAVPADAAQRCKRGETAIDVRKDARGRLVTGPGKGAVRACAPARPVLTGPLRRIEARLTRALPAGARRVRVPARLARLRPAVGSAAAGLASGQRRLKAVPQVESGTLDLQGAPAEATTTGTFTRDAGGPDEVGLITDSQVVTRLGRVGIGGGQADGFLVRRCPDAAGQVTGRFLRGATQTTVREVAGRRYTLTLGFRTEGTVLGTAGDDARAKTASFTAKGRLFGTISVEDARSGRALPGGKSLALETTVRHPGFDPRGAAPDFDDTFLPRGTAPPGVDARDLAVTAANAFSDGVSQARNGVLRAEQVWYGPEEPPSGAFGECVGVAFEPVEATVPPGGSVPVTARLRAKAGADPTTAAWTAAPQQGSVSPPATSGAPAAFTYTAPAEHQGDERFGSFEVVATSRRGRAGDAHGARHPARRWTVTAVVAGRYQNTLDADCGQDHEIDTDPSSTSVFTGVLLDPGARRSHKDPAVSRAGRHKMAGRFTCGTQPPQRAWRCDRPLAEGAWLGFELSTAPRAAGGFDVAMTTAAFRPPRTPREQDPDCQGPEFGGRTDVGVPQEADEAPAVHARFVVSAEQVASGSFDVPVGASPTLTGCGFTASGTTCTRSLTWSGTVQFRRSG